MAVTLKQRVYERSYDGAGSKHNQTAQHDQNCDDRKKPELLPFPHEAPKFYEELAHTRSPLTQK